MKLDTTQSSDKITAWLKENLKQGMVVVKFTKKDGTERTMSCTLKPELLPTVAVTESVDGNKSRRVNESVMAVYDLDIGEWRSFTVSQILSAELKA